jgi:hypothetical protein
LAHQRPQHRTVTTSQHPAGEHDVGPPLRQHNRDLFAVVQRDPEQEIIGVALPVVDWVMSAARDLLGHRRNPLSEAMVDLISPDTCGGGVPVRAIDAWIVVGQLLAALDAFDPEVAR